MEIRGSRLLFYGHEVFPSGLGPDVFLAIGSLGFLFWPLDQQKKAHYKTMFLLGYVWIMQLPNTLYLMMEFRHIVLFDNIADSLEPTAVIAFAGLSILGLGLFTLQVYLAVTQLSFLQKNKWLATLVLSYMSTWGAILGLNGLNSYEGVLFPPSVLVYSSLAFTSEWLAITVAIGTFVSLISLAPVCIKKEKNHGPYKIS
ncbi:hypothetical protein A3K34_04815 [candidate division WWE3 bacterium RIFOXYC1_FULL_40_10]|uniref:DUF1361 domain-containing protein n=1 Tax=candidate division WWE3 bacterium RIFOXYA2_FULL_46_9 TaxID=1802636 RepID=A0A1F4W179_UNCKA|nr:MAG: hypothetical protein A3K58_04815 [candidate division WWE3 bacterium RIFOXYB1_FULL_40_22]OGC62160.1 MAG: hypothetical protein A3K37_04815 [candidate division WWE3 bacterium RIFOXYA1_FULL_40_11]OGC63174.1 MAG: hypothetical protein A2264_00565 [candidate division WWE3 bacterium RIFOXYA2_FULL_46_9]OGC65254.1 MAG: hypothetical protein A2326_04200 [candidate division WWE3 bacterium RIFOXYB2_FULL_41_6]OGC66543.1 MAG: hypothetical protein A3K34_04815 [candidate division WWE3 bacterium RIFOXYC1_